MLDTYLDSVLTFFFSNKKHQYHHTPRVVGCGFDRRWADKLEDDAVGHVEVPTVTEV